MNCNLTKPWISFSFFLIYFFITPFWYMLYAYGLIGFYNGLILPLLFGCISLYYGIGKRKGSSKLMLEKDTVFLLGNFLLLTIIAIQIISLPWLLAYNKAFENYFSVIINTIFGTLIMWYTGLNAGWIKAAFQKRTIKRCLYGSYALFVLIILYGITINDSPAGSVVSATYQIKNPNGQYIMIADAFSIFSLLMIAKCRKRLPVLLVGCGSTFLLSATLSRTSFYFFLVSFAAILLFRFLKSRRKLQNVVLLGVMVVLLNTLFLPRLSLNEETIRQNRVFHIFSDGLSDDKSYNARQSLEEQGMEDLKRHWMLGDFMWEFKRDGIRGGYIHNWLSFWSAYGILPFFLSIAIVITSLSRVMKKMIMMREEEDLFLLEAILGITVFVFLSVLFSRSYIYETFWFAVGLAVCLNRNIAGAVYQDHKALNANLDKREITVYKGSVGSANTQ